MWNGNGCGELVLNAFSALTEALSEDEDSQAKGEGALASMMTLPGFAPSLMTIVSRATSPENHKAKAFLILQQTAELCWDSLEV